MAAPASIKVGDVVIPHRGAYAGIECVVSEASRDRTEHYGSIFEFKVVPVQPTPTVFAVDETESVRVIAKPKCANGLCTFGYGPNCTRCGNS